MTRKSGWQDSTNGPDWTDVETLMRAIGGLHSGDAGLTILPDGVGSTGGVSVAATIMFAVLPGSSLPPCVSVTKSWPCGQHPTLAAHAFALLYELDHEISKVYRNEELWK